MTNTVSHHKGWIAKTAGLFIVTALAIAYFAFPMLTLAAINPQDLSVRKLQNVTNKNITVTFITAVDGRIPTNLVMPKPTGPNALLGAVNLIDVTNTNIKDLKKGRWLGVTVNDTNGNSKYPALCTLFNDPKVAADGTSATLQCAMGQFGNAKLTPATLISQVESKLCNVKVTLDPQGKVVVASTDLEGSGWGALASINVR